MPKQRRVPVTMRALIQRINRKLREDDEMLKAARGGRGWSDLGDYYIIDLNRNFLLRGHVDPEQLGRKIGALKPWEEVAE